MKPRDRQWLAAAVVAICVLAALTAWLSYLNARSNPHYQQVAPGEQAVPQRDGGMPIRLSSLTITQQLVTDREVNAAPANALWVIAVIDYVPPPDGASCSLALLAVDGRRWTSRSSLDFEGSRPLESGCLAKPGEGAPRAELIYLIPESAAGSLAGLVQDTYADRGTEPTLVLTPPG